MQSESITSPQNNDKLPNTNMHTTLKQYPGFDLPQTMRGMMDVVGMSSRVGQGQRSVPADVPGVSTEPSQEDRLRPKGRSRQQPAGDSTKESQSRRR
jgi:hypothetical protein